jgi:hypothetical protein
LSDKFSVVQSLRGRLVWVVYFSLGLCLAYSLFYLASHFSLSFFVLSNRGMVEHAVSGSLISANWDLAVWASAVFAVIAWLFYSLIYRAVGGFYRFLTVLVLLALVGWVGLVVFGVVSLVSLALVSVLLIVLSVLFSLLFFGVSRFGLLLRLLFGCVWVVLFVEVVALVLFNVPVALNFGYGAIGLHWSIVELSFSNLAYPFLPYVYFVFVFLGLVGFVVRVLPAGWLTKIWSGWFAAFLGRFLDSFELGGESEFGFRRGRFVLAVAVLAAAVVSCLFVLFTVLPWVNPTHMLVSVDSPRYYQWIVYMRSVDVNRALSFAFANDRALFLVLAYGLSFLASPLVVVQFVAALLIVMFGIVSLLVLQLFCSFRVVWVFGVLFVPFSFQALGLIYAGYFANMLALILVFVYVLLFFRLVGSWSSLGFFALLGVSVLVLFSHSWTWFVFAVSLLAFLFLEWRLALRDRGLWGRFKVKCVFVVATVGVGLFVDLVRGLFSPVSSSVSIVDAAGSGLSFPSGNFLLAAMQKNVDFALGGVFANGLLMFLSFIGFLFLLRFKSEVTNFLVSWVFVACLSILFAAQDYVFDRFLFLLPWVVLSSLGLFSILGSSSRHFDGRKGWPICLVVSVFVFLVLLNGALRYLFNINIW